MSKRLDETIGAVGFDNLINGQYPPAEVFTVKIRKEATEAKIYKRGTVLALSAGTVGDGLRVILGTAAKSNETLTANCVLADDVEVGTASDAAIAMEMGCDGVLMNTAIAKAQRPVLMAHAMKYAVEAGRAAFLAGRMPRRFYSGTPSSPGEGLLTPLKA